MTREDDSSVTCLRRRGDSKFRDMRKTGAVAAMSMEYASTETCILSSWEETDIPPSHDVGTTLPWAAQVSQLSH